MYVNMTNRGYVVCLYVQSYGYISVLQLSCFITTSAPESPGLLPSCIAQHHHTRYNPSIFIFLHLQYHGIQESVYNHPIDRRGQILSKKYTTSRVSAAVQKYKRVADTGARRVEQVLQSLCDELQKHQMSVIHMSNWALVLQVSLSFRDMRGLQRFRWILLYTGGVLVHVECFIRQL